MKACELENLLLRNMIENNSINNVDLPTVKECGDNTFDVNGDVLIVDFEVDTLGVKFNNVSGSFGVVLCKLGNLEILPNYIGGSLILCGNQIDSLEDLNTNISGHIDLDDNYLTSLDGLDPSYNGRLSVKRNFLFEVPDSKKYKLVYENNFVLGLNIKVQKNNPGNGINQADIEIAFEEFKDKFYSSSKVLEAFKIKGEDFLIKFLNETENSYSNLNLDLTELKEWVYRLTDTTKHVDIIDL